ncbi:conserved hypothetical protein [Gammaproteobacteria bacterium]
MNRTYSKIAKLHSLSSPGWSAPDITPQEWTEQTIKPLLSGIPVTIEVVRETGSHPGKSAPQEKMVRMVCDIRIPNRSHHYYYGHDSCALYWAGDARHVALSPTQVGGGYFHHQSGELRYLADAEALVRLIRALNEESQQALFREQKRDKIKAIKRQAIVAQLRQIAAEERFAFYVETSALRILIGVRMDDNNQLEITIPFSEFENILPQVREAVIKLRALHQYKIRFKTIQINHHRDWITPDPIPSP